MIYGAWICLLSPLAAAGLITLAGGRISRRGAGYLATLSCFVAFGGAIASFVGLLERDGSQRTVVSTAWTWISGGSYRSGLAVMIDPLSVFMMLIVSGVGALIVAYSIGYMDGDKEERRYFAYMALFVFSMLLLVQGGNLLLLLAGWGMVGLSSYLLIGFWHERPSAIAAAKKAFVMNAIGDATMALALFLLIKKAGSVEFGILGGQYSSTVATLVALGLLGGAVAKSAQLPLQSWLLDAMEGPTPVSALIHAATMVTAGVYLIVRSHVIYDLSPTARLGVTVVGAVTLLWGAIIGCAKDDIKKALAGSTMSQIGYMTLGAGLGPAGYVFAIAHLLAHGFFKAGLFLGAGAVKHEMDDEVDMRRFGGLRKIMPVTFVTFLFGYLAIVGVPPFSGFFTKDGIIEVAFDKGGTSGFILGCAAVLGAAITAFYMTRVMFMTFAGQRRWEPDAHPHEAPAVMTAPMILLAVGSAGAGAFLVLGSRFGDFLRPVTGAAPAAKGLFTVPGAATLALVIIGVVIAWLMYGRQEVPVTAPAGRFATVAARKDLYGDAINESVLMRPGQWLTRLSVYFDNRGVDGIVNTLAATLGGTSGRLRRLQTGFVRSYALSMFVGAVLLVGALLLVKI